MGEPFVQDADFTLYMGDVREVLRELEDESVDCVVTSPPYLDARPEYPSPGHLEWQSIFSELRRVVTGPSLFNVGRIWRDHQEQLWWVDLLRIAGSEGWDLLDTLVWIKPNANPISGEVFANSHEYVLILGRPGELLNEDAIRTEYAESSIARLDRGWRNHIGVKNVHSDRQRSRDELNGAGARPRSYIVIATGREKANPHPAPMAADLAAHLVALASWPGQTVLDPFAGSGTTALAARKLGRKSIGIELNPDYAELAARRLSQQSLLA